VTVALFEMRPIIIAIAALAWLAAGLEEGSVSETLGNFLPAASELENERLHGKIAAALARLEATVGALETTIATLRESAQKHAPAIAELESTVARLESTVGAHAADHHRLESTVAAQQIIIDLLKVKLAAPAEHKPIYGTKSEPPIPLNCAESTEKINEHADDLGGSRSLEHATGTVTRFHTAVNAHGISTNVLNVTDLFITGSVLWHGRAWGPNEPTPTPTPSPTPNPTHLTSFLLQSSFPGELATMTVDAFKTQVGIMWDNNVDTACRSPWFSWRVYDNGAEYADSRVCFTCDFETWSSGHAGDTPTSLWSSARWIVTVPALSVNIADNSGSIVRAVMYKDDSYAAGTNYGLHYKRTNEGEHFPWWDASGLYQHNGYLCNTASSCGYLAPTISDSALWKVRIFVTTNS